MKGYVVPTRNNCCKFFALDSVHLQILYCSLLRLHKQDNWTEDDEEIKGKERNCPLPPPKKEKESVKKKQTLFMYKKKQIIKIGLEIK